MDVSDREKRKREQDDMPPPKARKPTSSPEDPIEFSFTTVGTHGFMVHTLIVVSGETSKTIPPTPIKEEKPKQEDYNSSDYVLIIRVDGVDFNCVVSNGRIKRYIDERGNIRVMPGDGVMPIPQPDRSL